MLAPPAGAADPDDDPAAVAALRRAAEAARSASFEGTEVTTAWTATGASTHVLDVVQRDGRRWNTVRDAGTAVAGTVTAGDPAPATVLALLVERYRVRLAGRASAAGRPATVVIASVDGREAARWWLDTGTGLVLRQEVDDAQGRMRRMSAFVDLRRLSGSPVAAAPPAVPAVLGGPVSWNGAPVPTTLPGGLRLVDSRRSTQPGGADVLHLTYTDGLCGVSMFLQHGRLAADELHGYQAQQWGGTGVHVAGGWPVRVLWQHGDSVVTMVADADTDEMRGAVAAMPGDGPPGGMLAAALAGVDSVLRWLRG